MTPERWRKVEQVYQSTMDREPRLRAAFLSEACGSDHELRREVDSLLELNHSPVLVDEPAWQAVAELLTDSTQLAPGSQLGPYRIEAMLGAGGMGRVYQAHDTRLGRTVALKISRVEFNERFEREARAVAALNHPNVCTIHDVGPNYLVMELVEGPTLSDRMKEGPIPLEEALRIARQIADALEAAHEKGIVHRDLKPGNIKIKPDGTVKVLDFGLAKLRPVDVAPGTKPEDSPTISMTATSAGMILGTAAYMSPEQARGKMVDKRADIWAFGVVLYEMVAGRHLFEGEDVTETLALVIKGEPKWEGIPANVQRLLKSCLEKDAKQRLRDIADAWRLLDEAPTPPTASTTAPWLWRSVAGVAIVAASALAFVHFLEKPPQPDLVRFEIAPPAQSTFAGAGGGMRVSPDGRRVAFPMRGPDGRTQLWVRSLDSPGLRPVAGTEGASGGFWSPDSRFLGFLVQGKVKKVDASGGPPQTICDFPVVAEASAPGFRAAAWSRDGVILFGTATTGLLRVPDAGGAPSPVTALDRSRKEAFHAEPDFLPDGRHFLYGRIGGSEDAFGVYVGSLDAKPEQQSSQRLLEGASAAVYAPGSDPASNSGYVLFNREGQLMVQAFDAGRLSLSGVAVPIAEGIGRGGPIKFSVSGTGVLAYRTGIYSGTFVAAITQLTWFDRDGKPLGIAGEPGGYNTVALSPDGSRVAVSRSDTRTTLGWRGSYDIWVHEFARGIPTRITSESASNRTATWSPDGRSVIFSSDRDSPVANLYQKVATGAGDEVLLLKSNDDKSVLDCSRDGRFLLFSVGAGPNVGTAPQDLWVLPLTSGKPSDGQPEPYLKTRFNESQGRFSPDSRFIAYTSDLSGRNEIYVQPFPTASGDRVTVSRGGGVAPRWGSDGKELFYISDDSKMMAVEVSTNPVFKAGIPKVLFQAPVWGGGISRIPTRYDVTADGKKFLINSTPAEAGAPATSPISVVVNWTRLLKK